MKRADDQGTTRGERLKRVLMVCCALVLFILGVWLLIEPVQAHDAKLMDNVDANNSYTGAAGVVMVRG
jgi:hypothetical protein